LWCDDGAVGAVGAHHFERATPVACLPTIGSFQAKPGTTVRHMDYGVFEVINDSYSGNFTAGGSMSHTPGA
jgi:hypothetical protein